MFLRSATLASPQVAHTFGWDTVSVVSISSMNDTIERTAVSPAGFVQADAEAGYEVKADFGHWRIGNGGDGRLLQMEVPLQEVQASYANKNFSGNLLAQMQVELQFLPQPVLGSAAAGKTDAEESVFTSNRLMIRTSRKSNPGLLQAISDDEVPIASVLHLQASDGARAELDAVMRAVIKQGLQDWLCENLSAFGHVFASVNLYQPQQGAFSWLKPTYATYHFLADTKNPRNSAFAILCRTGGRDPALLSEQLSPFALPAGSDVAYLISPERMLEDMIAPALPQMFPGLLPAQIKFIEDDLEVCATTSIKLKTIEHEGRSFDALLESLTVAIDDNELTIRTQTSTKVSPGIYSVCSASAFYHIGLVTNDDGEPTLGYRDARDPEFHDWTRKEAATQILEWVLAAIGVIAGLLMFVPGVNGIAFAALFIVALTTGGGAIAIKVLEATSNDNAPPLETMISKAAQNIRWANGQEFELTSAELNGSLQLSGNFRGPVLRL